MDEENEQSNDSVNSEEKHPVKQAPKSKKGLIITIVVLAFLIIAGAIAGY